MLKSGRARVAGWVVILIVVLVGAIAYGLADNPSSAAPKGAITSFSFGQETIFYDRGNYLVTSSPQIGPRGDGPVTVLAVSPVHTGCNVRFGPPRLERARPNAPYDQGYAVPPADDNMPITSVKHRGSLVLLRRGIAFATWFYAWEFKVEPFCRLTVTGYEFTLRTSVGVSHQFVPQSNIYLPTTRNLWRCWTVHGRVPPRCH